MSRIGNYNAGSSGYSHEQGTSNGPVVRDVPEPIRISVGTLRSVHKERLVLRQRHIVVLMVLRSGIEKPPKVLARSATSGKDKIGILNPHFGRILRALKRHLGH